MTEPVRIAMWSGPRNISTAMMRSWGARPDCAVSDEPLYAHYLTTLEPEMRDQHPVAGEILASQPSDWREVVSVLTGPTPGDKPVWYQKHMAHHLTPGMDRAWTLGLANCLLIRDPREMLTSFIKVIPNPTPEDLGLPQQVELLGYILEQTGKTPPVIDSKDVLEDPRGMLNALCEQLGVAFDESMLAWDPGPRKEDGVWAPHWYASVERSTGFAPYTPKDEDVPERLGDVLAACDTLYATLAAHRINP